ncbi:hypothetical protein Gogos_015741, partial [Gossypium gossypioides]|nr:hypothetical protein [Gossypium gossypioides]
ERKLYDGIRDSNIEPICGRPLGLKFDTQTCHLNIADAYFGLLVVGPNGGTAIRLAISAKGVPFKFTNGLDIDTSTGMVYFTDSSSLLQIRDADFLVSSRDKTERLLKYNPYTGDVSILYKGLAFPNGVALSAIRLFSVADNIKRNKNGEFWVALNNGRLGTITNGAPDPIGMKFNQ